MTLSLGLTFALFFLAPGFGFFAGLFYPTRHARLRRNPQSRAPFTPDPPPPGSTLALGIIVAGALTLHAGWSAVLAGSQLIHAATGCCFTSDLNLYAVVHRVGLEAPAPPPGAYAAGLIQLVALTVAGYRLGVWALRRRVVQRALLGWLQPLDEALADERAFLAAFVLSKLTHEGVQLGYRGTVISARLDSDRQVAAVVLGNAVKYTLSLHADGTSTTREVESARPLPLVQLERHEIANIVLSVVIDEAAPTNESPAPGGPARG